MKFFHYPAIVFLSAVVTLLPAGSLRAQEWADQKYQMTLTAGGSTVNGDADDFRAHRWMSDGTSFGIRDFIFQDEDAAGVRVEFRGHALNEGDVGVELNLRKDDLGFLNMEYELFRKYFDNTGGVYYLFTTFPSVDTKDLALDIGEFKLEAGTPEDDAKGLSAYYEHHYKDGLKSRLTWGAVKEGSTTRNISPTWQDIDETVDVFGLKERTEAKGFNLKGEQRLELVKVDNLRQEQSYSTNATASEKKIRRQHQEVDATVFSTKFHGDKWFNNDESYFSAGYLYQLIDGSELENLNEFDEFGAPRGFSSPKNKPNATAGTDMDSHTVVSSYMMNPAENLNVIIKVKGEIQNKEGDSLYPNDTDDPPDGIGNNIESNSVDNKVRRLGESIALRYSGIPKTSSYLEYDAEQTYNSLWEQLVSVPGSGAASSGSDFERETRDHVRKDTVTLGARTVPVRWFNMTNQARYRWEKNDYDDMYETSGGSTARSAFVEELRLRGPEFETKFTWKPKRWFQSSLRYQLMQQEYSARTDTDSFNVAANVDSNTITYDMLLQPIDPLLLNLSYSTQDLRTETPASSASSTAVPNFKSDVDSWLLSASYAARADLSYFTAFNYSLARNFNDFTSTGLPYGSDFNMYDLSLGVDWSPDKKDWTVKPRYSYYRYDPNPDAEEGGYSAHAAWVDVTYKW